MIAIDNVPERRRLAEQCGKAETIIFDEKDKHNGKNEMKMQHVYHRLQEMTNGRGPDRCIDAVGTEVHVGGRIDSVIDRAKVATFLGHGSGACATRSDLLLLQGRIDFSAGVYLGLLDNIPFGAAMNKGLTFKSGQTHMQRYMKPLLKKIEEGQIDPSFVITHRVPLEEAPEAYRTFRDKKDGCIKVVIKFAA